MPGIKNLMSGVMSFWAAKPRLGTGEAPIWLVVCLGRSAGSALEPAMTKRNPEASTLRQAALAGVLYIAAGAALAVGGFFSPHSLAREAALVSGAHTPDGHPIKTLMMTAHQVVITGHHALVTSLHLAMIPVHECLQLLSSLFGI